MTPALLTVSVTHDLADGGRWLVKALFTLPGGHQFAAAWPFPTQGEAEAFADDPGVVELAGAMALDELSAAGAIPPLPQTEGNHHP